MVGVVGVVSMVKVRAAGRFRSRAKPTNHPEMVEKKTKRYMKNILVSSENFPGLSKRGEGGGSKDE